MKKKYSKIGILAGVAFVIVGVLAIFGVFGGETSSPSYAPASYDSGYAEFGGDYYTYSVNNTAATASAARVTAYNVAETLDFLKMFMGISSILIGVAVICGFGIVLAKCNEEEEKKWADMYNNDSSSQMASQKTTTNRGRFSVQVTTTDGGRFDKTLL